MRKKLLSEYYRNLVEDYQKLLMLGFNKTQKEKIIENLIFANSTNKKPIILVSSDNYWDEKVDSDNTLLFSVKETNILESIKLAMDANRKLVNDAYMPIIIIDNLEEIYNEAFDIDTLTFYEEAILKNLADYQRIIYFAEHIYPTLKRDTIFDINENLLFDIDAVAISDEYLNNDSHNLKELKMILRDMLDWKFGRRFCKEINQMIEDKDPRLEKGIVLDPYELEITGFKL